MNKYLLMKIIESASNGVFRGRKRLQKVVFFAQESDLALNFDAVFSLHRYGPYSHDLSEASEALRALNLITEDVKETGPGIVEYNYTLSDAGKRAIVFSESSYATLSLEQFESAKEKIKQLGNKNLWQLELGSTILFYYKKLDDWDEALNSACEFKKVKPDDPASIESLRLAKVFCE